MSSEAKHQIIFPKNSHVTSLLIDHYHKLSGHSGRQHVLSLICQKYWVLKANSTVRKVLTNCYKCRRQEAPFCGQRMADLPEDRLTLAILLSQLLEWIPLAHFKCAVPEVSSKDTVSYSTVLPFTQCILRFPIASTPTRSCFHSGGLLREEAKFEK